MTIEELAVKIATQRVGRDYGGKAPTTEDAQYWHVIHSACYEAATEQDRIARQEERERCINTIREQMNKLLYPIEDIDLICDHVRKAMEGGEQ